MILAPGSSPPPGVKITEHSTIMGVFVIVTSPALAAFSISACDFSTRAWYPGFHVTKLICHNGEQFLSMLAGPAGCGAQPNTFPLINLVNATLSSTPADFGNPSQLLRNQ